MTFWFEGDAPAAVALFQEVADDFAAERSGVNVEITSFGFDDFLRVMPLALDGGEGPDVAYVPWGLQALGRYALAGHAVESTALAAEEGWLGDSGLVLPALFIAWSWVHYGFTMIIFIAAIDAVDEVFFDAAKVDGANWWQQFRHILLPSIRGALTTIILVTAISSFQVFDLVYVLTRGGPGDASMVVPVYMLESAFTLRRVGYGATVAIAMGLVIVGFSVLFLSLRGVFKVSE